MSYGGACFGTDLGNQYLSTVYEFHQCVHDWCLSKVDCWEDGSLQLGLSSDTEITDALFYPFRTKGFFESFHPYVEVLFFCDVCDVCACVF